MWPTSLSIQLFVGQVDALFLFDFFVGLMKFYLYTNKTKKKKKKKSSTIEIIVPQLMRMSLKTSILNYRV